MLRTLFESTVKEKILLFLLKNRESYPSEMARNFNFNLNAVQYQLAKLESAGVLSSRLWGKVRLYGFNPRFAMKNELLALLEKSFDYIDMAEKEKYYLKRQRPRKAGKLGTLGGNE